MRLVTSKDGFNLEINPELFFISEFSKLIEERKNNDLVLKELGYIYFFYDLASDFQFEANTMIRSKDVIRYVNLPSDWTPDKLVKDAIEAFLYLSQTPSGKLLEAAYIGADKLKKQLETMDINERDKTGKPIWNIKQFNDTLKSMADTIGSLNEAEKKYIKSQEDNSKLRGDRVKSIYEDGFIKKNN